MKNQAEYFRKRMENLKQVNYDLIREVGRLNKQNAYLQRQLHLSKTDIMYSKRIFKY